MKDVPSGVGASTFLDLTDVTPDTYVGHAGESTVVNAAEDGLEFADASSVVANPGGTGLLDITTIEIDGVAWNIAGMGGGGSDGVTESLGFAKTGDTITATIGRSGGLADVMGMFDVPAQVQPDWDATAGLGQIQNQPDIDDVLTGTPTFTGNTLSFSQLDGGTVGVALPNINDVLTGQPVVVGQELSFMQHDGDTVSVPLPSSGGGGAPQVQTDWDATSGLAQILNQPDLSGVLSGINGITGNTLTFDRFGGSTTAVFLPNDNNYVDSFVAALSGQDLTMTLGRTGLVDLAQTVTLPAGAAGSY